MFALRTVTSLAIHMRMFALRLHVLNVRVASLAGFVPGKLDRMGSYLADGSSTIMPILPKAFRDNVVAHHQKHQKGEDK